MSIRIVPESERSPGVEYIAPVRLPDATLPYARRSARLRQLADGHAMADYLLWAADLAGAQQA
ncbi:formate dehydrogenase accessory protein FdhE domain-containing protein, partial [Comamonas terrigena]|uniref:formate dehydrogenase accessory protein FdhE domain-containing protein n=1 Tax=Comamonas terrigena TaxID=32013 RepID=UPI0028AD58B1